MTASRSRARSTGRRGASERSGTPDGSRHRRVLLASEGRVITAEAIEFAAELASDCVRVISIARVHGVAFGLPNPGLMPTRAEWQEQRDLVARAVKALRRRGLQAEGQVVGTRKATKRILQEAADRGCEAIVMAADAPRGRLVEDLMWSQEPYRIRRRSRLPVYLVTGD